MPNTDQSLKQKIEATDYEEGSEAMTDAEWLAVIFGIDKIWAGPAEEIYE